MKKIAVLTSLFSLLVMTGCQKTSGNIWDDNQTGAKYKHSQQNASALWGSNSSQETLAGGPVEEDFIPLNEEDLKGQFADAAPQPSKSLGEGGVPMADLFKNPSGELAAVFHPIFFNTDEHVIQGKDQLEFISRAASYLKAHPNMAIIIEGHCDERGPEAYNLALGAKRSNSVRSLLIKKGVHPDQVHTISCGKEFPFALGHNPEAWKQNRRAHFKIYQR
ncbi:MAG: OmpA family protein [Verrucomicrobia bacterium]|nr:OmpA family protein [Verrucomicrobiota bacterium]